MNAAAVRPRFAPAPVTRRSADDAATTGAAAPRPGVLQRRRAPAQLSLFPLPRLAG